MTAPNSYDLISQPTTKEPLSAAGIQAKYSNPQDLLPLTPEQRDYYERRGVFRKAELSTKKALA